MIPTLFEFGPFTVYSLWTAVVIAFIVGTMIFLKWAKYERMDLTFIVDHSFSLLIGSILTSRLVFFINNWGFFGPPSVTTFLKQTFFFWQPGFSFWGGLLGFCLIFLYHCHRKKEKALEWLNISITPLFIGIMIGNIGQFLDGQGYGKETGLPWGVVFESTNVKYTVPIHPTQIYSAIILGIILVTHKKVAKKWPELKDKTNWTFFAIAAYSLARFLLEFIRGDDTLQFGFIRIGHIISLIVFVTASYLLYKRIKKNLHN